MMADGILSPLQLTAAAGLLQGHGIAVSAEFSAKIQEYESISLIADFLETLSLSTAANLAPATILQLQTLGSVDCPALADSIPDGYAGVAPLPAPNNSGFVTNVETVGNSYVSNVSKFTQAFSSAQGYISLVNQFINSAANANEYLGPTFTNINDMITADLSKVTTSLDKFGNDLQDLGALINLSEIQYLGEPATLLQQLVAEGKALLPCINSALRAVGLSTRDINDLVTNNRVGLFNPEGLTENQFGKLQQRAYNGLTAVTGACLQDALDILNVTTPNINTLADLLDPAKIFPTSYTTLKFKDQMIYLPNGSVNSNIAPILNATTPTGCDELGKIIPQSQAAANKALQFSLQQVSGISNLTLPELAGILV